MFYDCKICGAFLTLNNKAHIKTHEQTQKHKDALIAFSKLDISYYEKNKEKLNKKIECFCGSTVSRQNYKTHLKSQRHKHFLKTRTIYNKDTEELKKEIILMKIKLLDNEIK